MTVDDAALRERAGEIVREHDDLLSDYPSVRFALIDLIASALVAARAEQRERDSKATCMWCREDQKPCTRGGMNGLWHVGFDRDSTWHECKAAAILVSGERS